MAVGAVSMLTGLEVRRQWRRVVALTVLVGLVGAAVLTLVAGARRTGSSLERFRSSSRSADVELAVLGRPTTAQLEELDRTPGVIATAAFRAFGIVLDGLPNLEAVGVPVDATYGTRVDRGRIIAGRAVDPEVADEVAIPEALAGQLHARVGDRIGVTSYSPEQIAAVLRGAGDVGTLAGPKLRLRIVGIERRPLDLSDRAVSGGFLALSPAFGSTYADRIGVFGAYLRVRTRTPSDVVDATAAARRVFGAALVDTQSLAIETEGARDAIHLLTLTLWILAGIVALAGAFVIGIVMSREISLKSADYATERAIGLTRAQRVVASVFFATVIAGGGALIAVIGAVGLSPVFPIGVARRAEPNLGVLVDWTTVILGVVALCTVMLVIASVSALRVTRQVALGRHTRPRHRTSTVMAATAGLGLAPTVRHGLRMAFESGRGTRTVPVRSAFAGAALGVLGVTAVLVFASSLDHLVATPRLYGWNWDFKVEDTTANTPCGGDDFGMPRQPGLASVAEVCRQNMQVDGRATPGLAFTSLRGRTIDPEVLEGRAPRGPREVALGSATADALGKRIGDTVVVHGHNNKKIGYEIVGRVVLPTLGAAQPLADGAVFTGEGLTPMFDQNLFSRSFVGRFAPGADVAAIESRIAAIPQLGNATGPAVAVEVERVRQVDWFPAILAALLGGLALLAVGHALIIVTRLRRRELAVFKVLGFRPAQVQATVAWQATALAAVGLIVGIPAGLVVGTLAWRLVANGLGVAPFATIPWLAVALTIPGALALVNLIAALPARAAGRTLPAVALRSE